MTIDHICHPCISGYLDMHNMMLVDSTKKYNPCCAAISSKNNRNAIILLKSSLIVPRVGFKRLESSTGQHSPSSEIQTFTGQVSTMLRTTLSERRWLLLSFWGSLYYCCHTFLYDLHCVCIECTNDGDNVVGSSYKRDNTSTHNSMPIPSRRVKHDIIGEIED